MVPGKGSNTLLPLEYSGTLRTEVMQQVAGRDKSLCRLGKQLLEKEVWRGLCLGRVSPEELSVPTSCLCSTCVLLQKMVLIPPPDGGGKIY